MLSTMFRESVPDAYKELRAVSFNQYFRKTFQFENTSAVSPDYLTLTEHNLTLGTVSSD